MEQFNSLKSFTYLAKYLYGSELSILSKVCSDMFVDTSSDKDQFDDADDNPFIRHRIEKNKCKKSPDVTAKVLQEIEALADYLQITPLQMCLLVVFICRDMDGNSLVDMDDIARFYSITTIDTMPFKPELAKLRKLGYIGINYERGSMQYSIRGGISESIINNEPFEQPEPFVMDRYKFCREVSNFIDIRADRGLRTSQLFRKVIDLEKENYEVEFVKKVMEMLPYIEDRTLFYEICDDAFRSTKIMTNVSSTISDIYDNTRARFQIMNQLKVEKHKLISMDLIRIIPAQMFEDTRISLTEDGKRLFFEDDFDATFANEKQNSALIFSDDLKSVNLFYDKDFDHRIAPLKMVLKEDKFKALQERLEAHNMPKGVAAIFYGAPGTGKTETVKQLAKTTGRSIFQVDISETKSCYVGESEKLVKDIFVKYRKACKREKLKPILLFNEADGVLTKRSSQSTNNPTVTQMQNAMQNIILEEMENLDGIMIATTNLQGNLDPAFERRFLYKVEFKKPDDEVKSRIWLDKLPRLAPEEAQRLSKAYDFSGGEIDNIVRKCVLEEVVSGVSPNIDAIMEFCNTEKFSKDTRRVGFN
ncbi:MAG: ATP-binding protein [Paludibacteraceae bacterium]|nr:ATP-binding protein [Paludibacteraceae bacterium]